MKTYDTNKEIRGRPIYLGIQVIRREMANQGQIMNKSPAERSRTSYFIVYILPYY